MFTIVHKDHDGSEEVFEAVRVKVFRKPQEGNDLLPGVVFDLPPGSDASSVHYGFTDRPGRHGPSIYVMNEAGATVATYHL